MCSEFFSSIFSFAVCGCRQYRRYTFYHLIVAFKRKLKISLKLTVKSYLKNELTSYIKCFDNSNMNTYVFTETRP